jgi:hypothetical protein
MTSGTEYLVSVEAHPGYCPNCLGCFNRHSGYRDEMGELFCSEECASGYQRHCPACGSEVHAERGYVPGRTGMPVTCNDEWHEEG